MMFGLKVLAFAGLAGTLVQGVPSPSAPRAALPVVDFGYAVHRATINETGGYYNFSNIRYGAPPTGNLRFAAPIAPTQINRTVNDGQQGAVCASGVPYWLQITQYALTGANAATLAYVQSQVQAAQSALTIANSAPTDPRATEDCLFLDVVVPKSIYSSKKATAPVLVWIYGGGYVYGDKSSNGNPATLIATAQENGSQGVIYVALNYRLGLFGWLSGSTFAKGGIPNAGLYDQRLALKWIQDNIYKFGGDASKVTVIGESAGGGSIMHQITAYGGAKGAAPFAQAILQSPGFSPIPGNAQQEATFRNVLAQAQTLISPNITDVAALRALNFTTLAALNKIVVAKSSPYGSFTFGPAVDGTFVPEMPGKLLLQGKFDKSVKIMVGHNSNEGAVFTSPFITSDTGLRTNVETVFPSASNATVDYMLNVLWPPVYDGTYGYTTLFERGSLISAEVSFTCNTRFFDLAYKNKTYAYYFTVPPGIHGGDIAYTFFNGDTTTLNNGLAVIAPVARALQRYITNFAKNKGNPNANGVPFFPMYQSNSTLLVVGAEGVGGLVVDPTANKRCDWLMQALYA